MITTNQLYTLREKIPKNIRKILPKIIRRKINEKFFNFYYLPVNLKNLPQLNYPDYENFEFQKSLIEKFNIKKKQTSFMTYPNLIELLLTKFKTDDNFRFLDMGGERIDFYLDLKKNFKNVEYFLFNQNSMIEPFYKIKKEFNYKDFNIIDKIEKIFDKDFDFVNFGSSIQYFNKYENLLEKITNNSKYIFFSGTHLYDTPTKEFERDIIVKQVNLLPKINFLYFLNRKKFFNIFSEKDFTLIFEKKNFTDNINYDNFNKYLENIQYSDFLFKRK
tara:strand:- start:36 stop:860 length:825 start_codon:yes stop_codon:yes gene_type:complete